MYKRQVIYTFGNASGVSREHGLLAIKPSGVPYDKMTADDIVITLSLIHI